MLLFLNMVIAIMGTTFGEVSEQWERSALITRTQMYADFMMLVNFDDVNGNYLYIVKPFDENDKSEIESAFEVFSKKQKKVDAKKSEA